MKRLLCLAVVAVALVLALSHFEAGAQTSPLVSPVVPPPGLANCPLGCIEVREAIGYPTCAYSCGGDVAPLYVTECVLGIVDCSPPAVTIVWHDAGTLWMGQYRLLQSDDGRYCLPEWTACE